MKKLTRHNEKGIVLVTVIIMVIVMMIVTIGVISTNYSQRLYSNRQIERMKAEILAKGIAWYNYVNLSYPGSSVPLPTQAEIDNITYTIDVQNTGSSGTTNTFDINISYP